MDEDNKFFLIMLDTVSRCGAETFAEREQIYSHAVKSVQEEFLKDRDLQDMTRRDHELMLLDTAIAAIEKSYRDRRDSPFSPALDVRYVDSDRLMDLDPAATVNPSLKADLEISSVALNVTKSKQFALNVGAATIVNLIRVLLQLATLPILARLLTPADYGVYALALPTISLFMMLADGGLGVSLARENENNRLLWSTAFWTLSIVCCFMGLLVCASGFVLAWISGEKTLIGLMCLLALSLPLLALTVVSDARLIRRGNLLYHCGADLCGLLVGVSVGLFSAYHGAGAWSFAGQYVSSLAVRAFVLNCAARSLPHFEYDFSSISSHIATGGWLILIRSSETIGKIIENTLFSKFFGAQMLGSYTLAFQLVRFSCESLTNPILSAFYAYAVRHDSDSISKLHIFLSRLILAVLLPFAVLLAFFAAKILPAILGSQWIVAASFVQIFIVPYSIAAASWLSGQILLRHGIVNRNALLTVAITVFRVSAVGCGIWLDVVIVAWLLAFSYLAQAIALTFAVPAGLGAQKSKLIYNFLSIFASASVAGSAVVFIDFRFGSYSLSYLLQGLIGVLTYGSILILFQRRAFYTDYQTFRSFIRSAKG